MRAFIRQLRPAFMVAIALTVICGVIYPLFTTGVGQAAFNDKANGSLIKQAGVVVGSKLIGQTFTAPQYFHSRPSAAGAGYDGSQSSGSNLGPTSHDLIDAVTQRVALYRTENNLSADAVVPVDAVTASASGLDADISIANARLQAPRVSKERGVSLALVLGLVGKYTDDRNLYVLGETRVNVLELNLGLDRLKS